MVPSIQWLNGIEDHLIATTADNLTLLNVNFDRSNSSALSAESVSTFPLLSSSVSGSKLEHVIQNL